MDTQEIATTFLAMLAKRDAKGLSALFAPRLDWYIPGDQAIAPWVGRRDRREQVAEMFEMLFANVEPIGSDLHQMCVEGEKVVIVGEFASRMLRTGRTFASPFSIHFMVRDGLIVRYRLLEDSDGLVKALAA
jgi:hypothetical protein